jgi:hypothetical protein
MYFCAKIHDGILERDVRFRKHNRWQQRYSLSFVRYVNNLNWIVYRAPNCWCYCGKSQASFRTTRQTQSSCATLIPLDDLLVRLSADCPWRDEPRGSCGARFADLPPRRPPDMPAARMRVIRGGKS